MHLAMACSWGPTDPTRATLPFLQARAAREQGDSVTVMLVHDAVLLSVQGVPERIHAFGPPSLGPILQELLEDAGFELLVCKPCVEVRAIAPEQMHAQARLASMGDYHRVIREHDAVVSNYG